MVVLHSYGTESHQPLQCPFHINDTTTTPYHVSFSLDGRYLAYSGDNGKITLWIVKDIAPQLHEPKNAESYLDADATNAFGTSEANDITEDERDDPYNNFFVASLSLQSSSTRRPWPFSKFPSRLHLPKREPIGLHKRFKHAFSHPTPSPTPPQYEQPETTQKRECRAVNEDDGRDVDNPSANITPGAAECSDGKGKSKQQEGSIAHVQTSPRIDHSSIAEPDGGGRCTTWKLKFLKRTQRQPVAVAQDAPSRVIEVCANRTEQVYTTVEINPPEPSTWNRFLDKICFPCGHWEGTEPGDT